MVEQSESLDKPETFLIALGKRLTVTAGVDSELVAILTTHILKATPAPNAVALAKDAIAKLAAERANQSTNEAANG